MFNFVQNRLLTYNAEAGKGENLNRPWEPVLRPTGTRRKWAKLGMLHKRR